MCWNPHSLANSRKTFAVNCMQASIRPLYIRDRYPAKQLGESCNHVGNYDILSHGDDGWSISVSVHHHRIILSHIRT